MSTGSGSTQAGQAASAVNRQIPLADRALLVRLTRKTYSPYARDDSVLDKANAKGVGNFNKHLFKDKNSRVAKANQRYSDIYEYHRNNTVPWIDNGPRMIRTELVQEYKQAMRDLTAKADQARDELVAHWDEEVQLDLQRISGINPDLAKAEDYPSSMTIRMAYDATITLMPIPNEDDFRIGMDAEDIQRLKDAATEAEVKATEHIIASLIEPLQSAAEKLKTEIGESGSIFRDSLTENIVEVAARMEKVNISTDPQVAKMIQFVKALGQHADARKDDLRSNPETRKNAANKIEETVDNITKVMDGLV